MGFRRTGEQLSLFHGVVGAVVLDRVAFPQLADDADGLLQHLSAYVGAGPVDAGDVLVETLPGADAQEEAAVEHHCGGGGGVGDDCRMHADEGGGDPGAYTELLGGFGDATEDRPDEGALTLFGNPGMEVVGDAGEAEADLFCPGRVAHQHLGLVLLAGQPVAELEERRLGLSHRPLLPRREWHQAWPLPRGGRRES